MKEGKEQRRERLEKMQEGKEQSVTRKCGIGWCVSLCLCRVASQQLASLNSVIEMTNRAAFFGFLQQLKLAILSLASHSWSPRPWNWIWLWGTNLEWFHAGSEIISWVLGGSHIDSGEWQFPSFIKRDNLIIWKNIWKSCTISVIAFSWQACVCN